MRARGASGDSARSADESQLPLIEKALPPRPTPKLKAQLELVRAAILLVSADKAKRLAAAKALGEQPAAPTPSCC